MNKGRPTSRRPYRMKARAKAAAATREKILDAVEVVFDQTPVDEITLAAIAKQAGVAVQTILRHFGSREGLFIAALVHAGMKMRSSRETAPTGNLTAAIGALVDHYDEFGERILRVLGAADRYPALRAVTDFGRAYHREWCEQFFADALEGLPGARRERRIAQLVTVTDIYVWKLLRRDHGLSRQQTKLAVRELLDPLIADAG